MYINLTPHEVHEINSNLKLPAAEKPLRIFPFKRHVKTFDGVEIFQSLYSNKLPELPPRKKHTCYIVSALTLNALPADRDDFVAPGNVIRNAQGTAIGCEGFRMR